MAARAAEVASRGGYNWSEADKAAGLQRAQQVQAADKAVADAAMDAWQELSKRLENQRPAERAAGLLGNSVRTCRGRGTRLVLNCVCACRHMG
jgi:hypothetical protein